MMMRSLGSRRCKAPFAYRYGMKALGSAAANPGSEPCVSNSSHTPTAEQANSSTIVGTTQQGPGMGNETTLGKKYKYKYKYPTSDGGKKRKRDGEGDGDEGVDSDHMQQKALPGEQYRGGAAMRVPPYKKRPAIMGGEDRRGIIQKANPGEQYLEGASTNDAAKQMDDAKKDNPPTPTPFMGHVENLANISQEISGNLRSAADIFQILVGEESIPENYRRKYNQAIDIINGVYTGAKTLKQALPYLKSITQETQSLKANINEIDDPKKRAEVKTRIVTAKAAMKNGLHFAEKKVTNEVGKGSQPSTVTIPDEVGEKPGESSIPIANVESVGGAIAPPAEQDMAGQGDDPAQAYANEDKAQAGGDPNRMNPITPATGSRQTPATANSIVSVKQLKKAAEHTARTLGPAAVHGTAEERANMGKGALDTYEFQGPYDYPVYPGGRPDDSLTMMGAWRTDGGNDSSLWYSKKTAKGANAKRNKYFKWSMKGGGRWRKMTKDEMVNVFQKGGQNDNRFYGTRAGIKFTNFQRQSLSNHDKSVALAKIGNAKVVNSEHGDTSRGRNKFVGSGAVGVAAPSAAPRAGTIGSRQQTSTQGSSNSVVGVASPQPMIVEEVPGAADEYSYSDYGRSITSGINTATGAAVVLNAARNAMHHENPPH